MFSLIESCTCPYGIDVGAKRVVSNTNCPQKTHHGTSAEKARYYLSYVFEFEVWSKLVAAVLYVISRDIGPCNNGIRLHTWLFKWRKYTRCGIFHDTFVCKFDDILLFWPLCFCTAIHSELQTREGEIQHVVWPMKFEAKENIRFRRHVTLFRIIRLLRGESIGHRNYKKWEIRMCYGRCYLKHGKSETWLHKHPCDNMRLSYLKLHSSSLVYKRHNTFNKICYCMYDQH